MGFDVNSKEGMEALVRGGWLDRPTSDFVEARKAAQAFLVSSAHASFRVDKDDEDDTNLESIS